MNAARGTDRVPFWDTMLILLPAAAGLLPLFVVWAAGGFVNFVWIDQNVTPAQAFALLAAMCWPGAAYFYVRTETDTIQGRESLGWPTVAGRLDHWEVRPFSTLRAGRMNRLIASYRYALDGVAHEGDLVVFGPASVGGGPALDALEAKYKPGMDVVVHYAPDQPGLAVLEPGDGFARERMPRVWLLFCVPIAGAIVQLVF
ncbi:MAG: DUF3592 domain-containing protein [Alphaproteobacteria bacterium]|nr:DUF3592 domain-containing protein [Alphaproteobacteria bacterium]